MSFTPRDKGSYLFRLRKKEAKSVALWRLLCFFPAGRLSKKRFLPKVSVELDPRPPLQHSALPPTNSPSTSQKHIYNLEC